MPCSAALSAIASSRRRFDSVRRRPSFRGRKSTPMIPSSRLRAISFRSISSIVIVCTGSHTFEQAQVHRTGCFGPDPAIKVGTVDIRSKRPRQTRLVQQRSASRRVCLVLAQPVGDHIFHRNDRNPSFRTDHNQAQTRHICQPIKQLPADELDAHGQTGMIKAAQQAAPPILTAKTSRDQCRFHRSWVDREQVEIAGDVKSRRPQLQRRATDEDWARKTGRRDLFHRAAQQT